MENKLHIINGYSDELFPINICVVRKYSDLPIGSGFKSLHWHEDLQFVLCTKGYVSYQVNGIEYELKEKEAERTWLFKLYNIHIDYICGYKFPHRYISF